MKARTADCKVTPWGLQAAIALQIWVKVRLRVLKRWYYVKIIVVCLVCKVCCKRTPPSYPIESSIKLLKGRWGLHTKPQFARRAVGA